MTNEQINIAIAESLGWKLLANNRWTRPCGFYADLPNYTSDLNAMHEAEIAMFESDGLLWHKYASCLDEDYVNQPYTIGATARQRAEAYLKTIEKCIK